MRKILFNTLSAVAALTFSAGALAQVVGSNHDMTAQFTAGNLSGGFNSTGQVCIYCHIPHEATAAAAPLWNRDATGATYTMYDSTWSSTIDMTVAGTPQGVSAACLGCHDGTVAVDALHNQPWAGPGQFWTSDGTLTLAASFANVGTNLTDDHPISVTYDNADDDEFYAIATVKAAELPFFGTGADQLECGTCHDVHYQGFAANESLRVDPAGSQLCLTCHIK